MVDILLYGHFLRNMYTYISKSRLLMIHCTIHTMKIRFSFIHAIHYFRHTLIKLVRNKDDTNTILSWIWEKGLYILSRFNSFVSVFADLFLLQQIHILLNLELTRINMVDCKIIFLLLALITRIMSQCNNYVSYYEGYILH